MKISSKGRYALRVLVELADSKDELMSLKEISIRQDISIKYLEQIVAKLCKNGIVEGFRGPNGGYKLLKDPKEITIADILEATEGELKIVDCLGENQNCDRMKICKTKNCWERLNANINEYLKSVSLQDLL